MSYVGYCGQLTPLLLNCEVRNSNESLAERCHSLQGCRLPLSLQQAAMHSLCGSDIC